MDNFIWEHRWSLIVVVLISIIVLLLSTVSETSPDPVGRMLHTVVKGDTLSEVAQLYGKNWRELAELNGLPIENVEIDGRVIPVVWLKVDQKILIEDSWTDTEIQAYKHETKEIMNEAFIKMAHLRAPPEVWLARGWQEHTEMSVQELEDRIKNLRGYYKWRQYVYETERRKRLVDLIHHSAGIWCNPWAETDLEWVAHRKLCFFITAMAWIESDGYNVIGTHGERNFLQILPRTACGIWKWKWKKMKGEIIEALDTMPTFSIITGIKMINLSGSTNAYEIACFYNSGRKANFKPMTLVHATKVNNKYRRLMNE